MTKANANGHDVAMPSDRERWDARYANSSGPVATPPDVLELWPELDDVIARDGRALDLACGIGGQSLWMAERGLDVVSVDVSPHAIALLDAGAEAVGIRHRIDSRVADTNEGIPSDLTGLSVIVCQRYRVPDLYGDLVDRLAPGGVLCLTVLSSVGLDGRPGPFHASGGELTAAFGADPRCVVVRDGEGAGLASIVVRRRVG